MLNIITLHKTLTMTNTIQSIPGHLYETRPYIHGVGPEICLLEELGICLNKRIKLNRILTPFSIDLSCPFTYGEQLGFLLKTIKKFTTHAEYATLISRQEDLFDPIRLFTIPSSMTGYVPLSIPTYTSPTLTEQIVIFNSSNASTQTLVLEYPDNNPMTCYTLPYHELVINGDISSGSNGWSVDSNVKTNKTASWYHVPNTHTNSVGSTITHAKVMRLGDANQQLIIPAQTIEQYIVLEFDVILDNRNTALLQNCGFDVFYGNKKLYTQKYSTGLDIVWKHIRIIVDRDYGNGNHKIRFVNTSPLTNPAPPTQGHNSSGNSGSGGSATIQPDPPARVIIDNVSSHLVDICESVKYLDFCATPQEITDLQAIPEYISSNTSSSSCSQNITKCDILNLIKHPNQLGVVDKTDLLRNVYINSQFSPYEFPQKTILHILKSLPICDKHITAQSLVGLNQMSSSELTRYVQSMIASVAIDSELPILQSYDVDMFTITNAKFKLFLMYLYTHHNICSLFDNLSVTNPFYNGTNTSGSSSQSSSSSSSTPLQQIAVGVSTSISNSGTVPVVAMYIAGGLMMFGLFILASTEYKKRKTKKKYQ